MEESFRVRVGKTFGSLAYASSSSSSSSSSSNTAASPSLSSLWSLTVTDEELERKEWNRERDDSFNEAEPKPYPPNLDGFFANRIKIPPRAGRVGFKQEIEADREDLDDDGVDDDEEEGKKRELVKPDDYNDEEWDIRSSIGLDCTLDFEVNAQEKFKRIKHAYNTLLNSESRKQYEAGNQASDYSYSIAGRNQSWNTRDEEEFYGFGGRLACKLLLHLFQGVEISLLESPPSEHIPFDGRK